MSIIINKAKQIVLYFLSLWWRFKYPHISSTTRLGSSIWVFARKNLYMDENTNLSKGTVIMNTRAKFIMKKNSGAAIGLLAITGNHLTVPGVWFKQVTDTVKAELDVHNELDRDIIVEELRNWVQADAERMKSWTKKQNAQCCLICEGRQYRLARRNDCLFSR